MKSLTVIAACMVAAMIWTIGYRMGERSMEPCPAGYECFTTAVDWHSEPTTMLLRCEGEPLDERKPEGRE